MLPKRFTPPGRYPQKNMPKLISLSVLMELQPLGHVDKSTGEMSDSLVRGQLKIESEFNEYMLPFLRKLPGRHWVPEKNANLAKLNAENIIAIQVWGGQHGYRVFMDTPCQQILERHYKSINPQ